MIVTLGYVIMYNAIPDPVEMLKTERSQLKVENGRVVHNTGIVEFPPRDVGEAMLKQSENKLGVWMCLFAPDGLTTVKFLDFSLTIGGQKIAKDGELTDRERGILIKNKIKYYAIDFVQSLVVE